MNKWINDLYVWLALTVLLSNIAGQREFMILCLNVFNIMMQLICHAGTEVFMRYCKKRSHYIHIHTYINIYNVTIIGLLEEAIKSLKNLFFHKLIVGLF